MLKVQRVNAFACRPIIVVHNLYNFLLDHSEGDGTFNHDTLSVLVAARKA